MLGLLEPVGRSDAKRCNSPEASVESLNLEPVRASVCNSITVARALRSTSCLCDRQLYTTRRSRILVSLFAVKAVKPEMQPPTLTNPIDGVREDTTSPIPFFKVRTDSIRSCDYGCHVPYELLACYFDRLA